MSMSKPFKFVLYGGIAVALIGAPIVIGALVSIATGMGIFAASAVHDGLPALVGGFGDYEPGQTPGLFGEEPTPLAPGPAPDPAAPAIPETTPASITGS